MMDDGWPTQPEEEEEEIFEKSKNVSFQNNEGHTGALRATKPANQSSSRQRCNASR